MLKTAFFITWWIMWEVFWVVNSVVGWGGVGGSAVREKGTGISVASLGYELEFLNPAVRLGFK